MFHDFTVHQPKCHVVPRISFVVKHKEGNDRSNNAGQLQKHELPGVELGPIPRVHRIRKNSFQYCIPHALIHPPKRECSSHHVIAISKSYVGNTRYVSWCHGSNYLLYATIEAWIIRSQTCLLGLWLVHSWRYLSLEICLESLVPQL